MRFLIRKKHQPPAVIIVALIDVLIVVLIFLMVTTTFKKPLAALKLALPESRQATKVGASEIPPVVITIEKDGGLRYGQDAKPVTLDELKTLVAAAVTQNPQLDLTLNADKNAPFGQIVKVMDIARDANIAAKSIKAYIKPAGAP